MDSKIQRSTDKSVFRCRQSNVRRVPAYHYCWALFRCLNCAQRSIWSPRSAVGGSWEEPPNIWSTVAKNTFVGWAFNFRVRYSRRSKLSKTIKTLKHLDQKDFARKTSLKTEICWNSHEQGLLAESIQTALDPEKFYNEFYCRQLQITEKLSLKFPVCNTNLDRLIQTRLLFFGPPPSAFVQPADLTPAGKSLRCGGTAKILSSRFRTTHE